jgi:nitrogen regulatory protein P-II 2
MAEALGLGPHGHTLYDVRGAGAHGTHEGAWDADRIAQSVLASYGQHYGLTLFFADVEVFRSEKC